MNKYKRTAGILDRDIHTIYDQARMEELTSFLQQIDEETKDKDPYSAAVNLFNNANFEFFKGNFDRCLVHCLKCEELCENNNFYRLLTYVYNLQGISYSGVGDFLASLDYLLKAYYMTINHPEYEYQYVILNNLGTLFHEIDCDEQGLEYYIRAFQDRRNIHKEFNRNDGIILSNILMVYYKLNMNDMAEPWMNIFSNHLNEIDSCEIQENIVMMKIYQASHCKDLDLIKELIYDLLDISRKTRDIKNTIKNFVDCIKICIQLDLENQANLLFKTLETRYTNSLNSVKLSEIKVEMAMKFCTKEQLHLYLLESYRLNKNVREKEKLNKLHSVLNKIDLERSKYQQTIIQQRNEELKRCTTLDAFTEVLNKKAFQQQVEDKLKEKPENQIAVLYILDVDDFKLVNDTYGHLIGDHVIMELASVLRKNVRADDLVGRIGGDEFCIYIDKVQKIEDIEKNALRVIQIISNMKIEGLYHPLTISMGACMVRNEKEFSYIYKQADHALYEAKENGRNQFVLSM